MASNYSRELLRENLGEIDRNSLSPEGHALMDLIDTHSWTVARHEQDLERELNRLEAEIDHVRTNAEHDARGLGGVAQRVNTTQHRLSEARATLRLTVGTAQALLR